MAFKRVGESHSLKVFALLRIDHAWIFLLFPPWGVAGIRAIWLIEWVDAGDVK